MEDLSQYTSELIERDGMLFSRSAGEISYPKEANSLCFQVEQDSFWFNHRNNCIIATVKKYCPDSVFFDIGGGNGFVARGLEEAGIRTVLVEPGIEGCLNAKRRNLTNIICSTLENAEFKTESVQATGMFDVVEHIPDDIAFLRSINSYLVKGGYTFITVPAYQFLWSREDSDAGHFRRYTLHNLEEKLKQTGFEIVYSTYIFSILPLPIFLFRVLPGKLGRKREEQYVQRHKTEKGIAGGMLDKVWDFELSQVRKGNRIPVGGSCFVVARKV